MCTILCFLIYLFTRFVCSKQCFFIWLICWPNCVTPKEYTHTDSRWYCHGASEPSGTVQQSIYHVSLPSACSFLKYLSLILLHHSRVSLEGPYYLQSSLNCSPWLQVTTKDNTAYRSSISVHNITTVDGYNSWIWFWVNLAPIRVNGLEVRCSIYILYYVTQKKVH